MAQGSSSPRTLNGPVFAQPEPTEDPNVFKVKHPSDSPAYKIIDQLNAEHQIRPLPFPAPRGTPEPQLTLTEVFGNNQSAIQRIEQQQRITFHATGDCGSTRGPTTQNEVTDKMIADFSDSDPRVNESGGKIAPGNGIDIVVLSGNYRSLTRRAISDPRTEFAIRIGWLSQICPSGLRLNRVAKTYYWRFQ